MKHNYKTSYFLKSVKKSFKFHAVLNINFVVNLYIISCKLERP